MQGARSAREAGYDVGDLVYEKQLAYGDASGLQFKLWKVLLQQYEAQGVDLLDSTRQSMNLQEHDLVYVVPRALFDHVPRLTRVFDRIARIISNPAADRMGEDPWRDLAGDALCGIVMPRTEVHRSEWLEDGLRVGEEVRLEFDFGLDDPEERMGHDPIDEPEGKEYIRSPADARSLADSQLRDFDSDPHPRDTRIWNEGAGTLTADLVRNRVVGVPANEPQPSSGGAEAAAARAERDRSLREDLLRREVLKDAEQGSGGAF